MRLRNFGALSLLAAFSLAADADTLIGFTVDVQSLRFLPRPNPPASPCSAPVCLDSPAHSASASSNPGSSLQAPASAGAFPFVK